LAKCSVAYVWDKGNQDINCDFYNCDINQDSKKDVLDGGTRGWLDLQCPAPSPYDQFDLCSKSGGANCLKCRIDYGYPGLIVKDQCLPVKTGVVQSDVAETGKPPALGQTYWLPLFDEPCVPDSGPKKGYRVEKFGCIQNLGPTNVCFWPTGPTSGSCPSQPLGSATDKKICEAKYDKKDWPNCKDKLGNQIYGQWLEVIQVKKECNECYAACSNAAGGTPVPGDTVGVQLVQ
jgi:hypothetical protein